MMAMFVRGWFVLFVLGFSAASFAGTSTMGTSKVIKLDTGRQYLLYVPAHVAKPAPVVMMFHGGGGDMQQAFEAYGWQTTADKYGFVLVVPNGSSRWPRGRLATWNAGHCCGYARDEQVDDIAFVRSLLADLPRQVAIDPTRLFATGMSNGGMLAHRLACDMATQVRAIAAVAGTDNTHDCKPQRAISVMHIHAKDDTHVLYHGGAGPDAFRDPRKVTDFTSVATTISRWQQRLHISPQALQQTARPGVTVQRWQHADGIAEVVLITTDSGGHSWPHSKPVRGKTPSTAINANDEIWQFFARQAPIPPEPLE